MRRATAGARENLAAVRRHQPRGDPSCRLARLRRAAPRLLSANRAAAKAGLVHLRIWVTKEQAEAIMAIIEADE